MVAKEKVPGPRVVIQDDISILTTIPIDILWNNIPMTALIATEFAMYSRLPLDP